MAERTYARDEHSIVITFATPDGERYLRKNRTNRVLVEPTTAALDVATDLLDTGGDFAAKVFDGQDLGDLKADIEPEFEYVREVRPDASRDSSSELYLVAKHRLTAPVREGDVVEVTIDDIGDEGDGIAKVENFTVFVSGAEEGETLDVCVDDVKQRYAFAEPAE